MPDPKDPTPVKVVSRGGKFVIVDADGKALADGDSYTDEAKAKADAAQINASWADAKKTRKANGSPAITEARVREILEAMHMPHFNPALHPHDREGQFAEKIGALADHQHIRTTAGVKVSRSGNGFVVHQPYRDQEPLATHTDPAAAAHQALMVHDDVASKGSRRVDAKGKTVELHPSKADAKRHLRQGEKLAPALEESVVSVAAGGPGLRSERPHPHLHAGTEFGGRRFIPYNPALHPHEGRTGHFAQKIGAAASAGGGVRLPSGVRVHQEGTMRKRYVVTHPDATRHVEHDVQAAAHYALAKDQELTPRPPRRRTPTVHETYGTRTRISQVRGRMRTDVGDEAASQDARWRRGIDEAVLAHGELRLRFDPLKHKRGRHGKFTEMLGKVLEHGHGATVDLPHGVKVENHLGKLRVHSPYGVSRFHTPDAAAAVALAGVDRAHGADPDAMFSHQMGELETARRSAMSSSAIGDVERVEQVQRSLRLARGERRVAAAIPSHRGRTEASKSAYATAHSGGDGGNTLRTIQTLGERHRAAIHLPAQSEEADAQRPVLSQDRMSLSTGYGEYALKPNPGASNIYDLHRNDQRLTVVGTSDHAHAVMAALHDEAMQRHQLARRDQRAQVVNDLLKLA